MRIREEKKTQKDPILKKTDIQTEIVEIEIDHETYLVSLCVCSLSLFMFLFIFIFKRS